MAITSGRVFKTSMEITPAIDRVERVRPVPGFLGVPFIGFADGRFTVQYVVVSARDCEPFSIEYYYDAPAQDRLAGQIRDNGD